MKDEIEYVAPHLAKELMLHLKEWKMEESPDRFEPGDPTILFQTVVVSTIAQAIETVEEASTIDAVKVTHCEECKYCRRENVTYRYPDGTEQEVFDRYINCTKERYQPEVRLDDFCSRGVRRTK